MSTRSPRGLLSRLRRDDEGLGIVTVIFLAAVLTALTITAVKVTVGNMDNTRRDRQALSALATSEAGVSQALMFLRGGTLSSLTCTEPAPGAAPGADCTGPGPSWTSATNPKVVGLNTATGVCAPGADCFKVWIGTIKSYVPNCPERRDPAIGTCSGIFRVHSTGLAQSGPGARAVAVDVKVTPYPFPIGVFAEGFSGNGTPGIHFESVFTNGCIMNRQRDDQSGSGFQFDWDAAAGRPVLDLIYDQPVAAHASGDISTSNNTCGTGSSGGPIHRTTVCNPAFPFDQDGSGGDLTPGDGCYGKYLRADGSRYPVSSKSSAAQLQAYGYRPRGLTDAQYDALRSQAQSQGTYNIPVGSVTPRLNALLAAGIKSPVLFWDNSNVSVAKSDFPPAFLRTVDDTPTCTSSNVTIVVSGAGHDLNYNGGNSTPYLSASIFVPDGKLTGQGGYNVIGTVFAKTLDLGGSPSYFMDKCFASNPPGALLDAQVIDWREADAKDAN
jgi:curved DNA-binding protein CbpA